MRQGNHIKSTVAIAAITLAVPFGGIAVADGGNGKGDERPQGAPGQEKKSEHAAPQSERSASGNGYGAGKSEKPAKPEKPSKPAKPSKPSKPSKPAKPAKPAKPSKPRMPAKPANPRAKAGKTTICHATGSAANPYVTITISDNALPAHARHQDGRDIIPAPAEGCPKGDASAAPAKPGRGQEKVTICHATGSATNPYVKITIAAAAVEAHRRHQDGRDIIPAPEGDCPAEAAAAPAAAEKRTTARSAIPASPPLLPAPAAALVAPAAASGGEASLPAGGVLGDFASGGEPPAPGAVAGETVTREAGADAGVSASLPFTGVDLWLVVVAGLGAVLAGVAFRRAATTRA